MLPLLGYLLSPTLDNSLGQLKLRNAPQVIKQSTFLFLGQLSQILFKTFFEVLISPSQLPAITILANVGCGSSIISISVEDFLSFRYILNL